VSLEKYKQVIHEDFVKDVDFIDDTIKELGLDKKAKILDIGTGLGAMSILLAINGFDVLTGQPEEGHGQEEHSHEAHCHGFSECEWRESAKALGVTDKIEFRHLNAEALDLPDESRDAIFMYDTLQHVKNRELALNESMRVIKPNGLTCLIEWNERSIKEDKERYGFTIDYIDPRKILHRDDVSTELIAGTWVNIFVIRKTG
jgi:ubiquinone/menaquinone biosynthesis C-methylase UbiE